MFWNRSLENRSKYKIKHNNLAIECFVLFTKLTNNKNHHAQQQAKPKQCPSSLSPLGFYEHNVSLAF